MLRCIVLGGLLSVLAGADVVQLTTANFQTTLALNPITMVEYYAPWCGHCKKFAPVYANVSNVLADAGILVAKVDCVAETDLYWEASIQSFPTIKMHVFSQVVPYNGPLELENVVSFGRKFITPYVIPMDEQKWYQYEELKLTERDPLFIIFTDQPKKTEFELSCAIFDRVNCAISDSQELANYLDVPFPSYSIIRRFPGEAETVVAPFGVEEVNVMDDLLIFLQKNSFPAVVEFSEDNKDLLFSSDRPGFSTHVIFPMDLSDADGLSILEIARKLAKDFFGKCIFASIDLSVKSRYVTNLLLELQIDKLDPPLALMVRSHGEAIRFFRLEYDYDAVESGGYDAMIKNWLASIFTGEITAERFITDSEEISIAATVSEEKNGSNDEL